MLYMIVVPVTLLPATLILVKREQNLGGKQNTALKKCAGIAGTGSGRIRMDILND